MVTTRKPRRLHLDTLPEQYPYRDDGCEVSPHCLECPLSRCKYDDPTGYHQELLRRRDQRVLEMRRSQGLSVSQLARRFGVSQRTVHRILRRARDSVRRPIGGLAPGGRQAKA